MNKNLIKLSLAGAALGLLGVSSPSSAQNVTPRTQNVTPQTQNVTPGNFDVTPPRYNVSPVPNPVFRKRDIPNIAPGLTVNRNGGGRRNYIPVPNYYYWGYGDYYGYGNYGYYPPATVYQYQR